MMKNHWITITPSQHPWERAALDFVRAGLPDHEPYRAWANFEFQSTDGAIYEVDLLVLTKQGFWLVEIKGRPGRVEGDAGTWTWTKPGGRRVSDDNPILLANRKAKILSSLLRPKMAAQKVPLPWLEALVFLSDPALQCDLQGTARNRVCPVDREPGDGRPGRPGILAALVNREAPGVESASRDAIDVRTARALARAMDQIGIRPSQKARRVGDYVLKGLLDEGPGVYQDHLAEHASLDGVFCRVRQYLVAQAASEDDRQRLKRAAVREFRILQSFDHPGILDARDYRDHESGPALLFAYEPRAMRLDHYLATRGGPLPASTRLELARQLADAVRYAHSKRVIHRALAPQSVLVMDPDAAVPRLKVFNWLVGVREAESATAATAHVQDLVDRQATVYMAPEALHDPRLATEAADVYSLGAIAFHLFTGRPPGETAAEVHRGLAEHGGLRVSSVLDGTGPALEEAILRGTDPDVDARVPTAADFLGLLDDVEDEMTAPEARPAVDPAAARAGDPIEGGFVVERFLGQGATGVALLARRGGEEFVLKVAREPEDNGRLREEAEALKAVRSEFVVGLREVLEVQGRAVLVLDKSGDETLAERLRKEARLGLELLHRFGEDLLQAVASLERHGVAHRDIKPDNIGVRSGKGRLQLVLFDFSLARVPPEEIRVGTHPYLDPFLARRKPPRWDQAAERYAAGVTLYEMAAGTLPRWGKSDPSLVDAPLAIEAERFDPAVRDGLAAFIRAALERDPAGRFDNAEEMLRAWRAVFEEAERRTVTTATGALVDLHVGLERADLETLVATLGLGTRATNALDRVGVATVRQLLGLPVGAVRFMRGVGRKTRDELVAAIAHLRRRFPDPGANGPPAPRREAGPDEAATLDLEGLRRRLVDTAMRGKDAPAARAIREAFLGLGGEADGAHAWPTQAEVAVRLGKKRQQVSQALTTDRERWANDPHATALRDELRGMVGAAGGVMTLPELAEALVAARGTAEDDPAAARSLGAALVRVAFEAEQSLASPRMVLRRSGRAVLLARTAELAEYADRLGRVADALAAEDPLPPSLRAFARLYEVEAPEFPPDCPPPNNERILRLAAAASDTAAVSTRQELYPRGMAARRALALGLGALTGLELADVDRKGERFGPEGIRARIAARYPDAEPLPGRPVLDELLGEAGMEVAWDEAAGVYRRPGGDEAYGATSGSTRGRRAGTDLDGRRRRVVSEEDAEARTFEERMRFALRDRAFLVLTVRPSRMLDCEREIQRRFPALERVSLDRLLLRGLRKKADELEIDWTVVLEADGAPPGSEDREHLLGLVGQVVPGVEAELLASTRPVLLVHPGLLARYGQVDLLERLRDRVGRRGVCPGLWVLVAADEQSELPLIDGSEVPLIGSGQRARVPLHWVENRHRGDGDGDGDGDGNVVGVAAGMGEGRRP